jgi:hypothetical protein
MCSSGAGAPGPRAIDGGRGRTRGGYVGIESHQVPVPLTARGRLPRQAMDASRRAWVVPGAVCREEYNAGTGTGNCHFFHRGAYHPSN